MKGATQVKPTTAAKDVSSTSATSSAMTAGAGATMVLAAAATTPADGGGSLGTYSATSLSPEGTWTGGDSAGSFNYAYSVTTPRGPSALVPDVSLSYNSSSVDGKTAS